MNKFSEIRIFNIENENKFNTLLGIISNALYFKGINANIIKTDTGIELMINTDDQVRSTKE